VRTRRLSIFFHLIVSDGGYPSEKKRGAEEGIESMVNDRRSDPREFGFDEVEIPAEREEALSPEKSRMRYEERRTQCHRKGKNTFDYQLSARESQPLRK